ncbi:hypothetical protein ACIHFD_18255 [Nonomuraea sp. NPDC051941]|uniref:hypothetical protein n=1 Tax=Nonomuraea sp. NPDC051941 TaxID=3364373 RepID=UPI0037CC5443
MNEPRTIPPRPRDRLYAAVTLVLAALLQPSSAVPAAQGASVLRVYFSSSAKAKRVLYCLALTNPASPLSTVQWSTNSSMRC